MGAVVQLSDAKLVGTMNKARIALIVRILSTRPETNTPAQSAKLAAAQRLLEAK